MKINETDHAEDAVFLALPDFRDDKRLLANIPNHYEDHDCDWTVVGMMVIMAFQSLFWFAMGLLAAWYWP